MPARIARLAVLLAALAAAPVARAADIAIPDTPQGRHVAAWLQAFNSNDAAKLRAFFAAHFSPATLSERPAELRAARHREMYADLGALEARAYGVSDDGMVVLTCRAKNGDEASVEFEFDPQPPHAIRSFGLRLEQGGPGGGPAAPAWPEPAPTASATATAIRAALDSLAREGRFSGAVLVSRGGQALVEGAWGLADRASGRANTIETRFNLGSINKLITKIAIAQLAQRGRLSLDDTIEKWVPELPKTITSRVTIAQLLAHRSGLGDFFGPRFEAADKSKLRRNADYLPLFADRPLEFEPGTRQRYSNAGYVVLGLIVERAHGEDYHEIVREQIYAPAGMTRTDSYALDEDVDDRAIGYTSEGGAERDNRAMLPGRGSAAGGGYSTVRDLERLAIALRDRTILDAAWSDWVLGGPPPAAGAKSEARPARGGFGTAGGSPGVNALFDVSLGPDWWVIVLANGDPPMAESVGQVFSRWVGRVSR